MRAIKRKWDNAIDRNQKYCLMVYFFMYVMFFLATSSWWIYVVWRVIAIPSCCACSVSTIINILSTSASSRRLYVFHADCNIVHARPGCTIRRPAIMNSWRESGSAHQLRRCYDTHALNPLQQSACEPSARAPLLNAHRQVSLSGLWCMGVTRISQQGVNRRGFGEIKFAKRRTKI